MFWTKKCAVSGLIMGFIGLKNRNLPLLFFFSLASLTHTHTHTSVRWHTQTHTHWTRGQTVWPAEWVCAVVMIRLLNGAVLCHASCWASGRTEGIGSIWSLSPSFSLPVPLSASPCLSLFQPVFYQSLRRSFFISAFLALWRNNVNLRKSNVNLPRCCFVRGIESSQCR